VLAVSPCVRKPLVATAGADRCVRIWNWDVGVCEVSRRFDDDAFSCSLHPTGTMLLVSVLGGAWDLGVGVDVGPRGGGGSRLVRCDVGA
jgi:hypothetical protein